MLVGFRGMSPFLLTEVYRNRNVRVHFFLQNSPKIGLKVRAADLEWSRTERQA